jgi:hypothetical protein
MRVVAVITYCLLATRPALSRGADTPTTTAWRIAAIRNMAPTDPAG